MKLPVDMNLSPRWVKTLIEAEIEASNWSGFGPTNASHSDIMRSPARMGALSSRTTWISVRFYPRREMQSRASFRSEPRMLDLKRSARC